MPKRYSSDELIALIEKQGWLQESQSGSHIKFKHPQKSGIVVIPRHGKDVPPGTAASIFRQAGIKKRN
jgi:predicted RNA binding protein YcfA (HicA-like mRNA interferase family)